MPHLPSFDEIARATGGRVVAGRGDARPGGVAIDSRRVKPGDLFFALPGKKADGHAFLHDAALHGASGAVVSAEIAGPAGLALVRVADAARALRNVGRHLRLTGGYRVVGITGSMGKTTTKELAAAALGGTFRVHQSEGNLNNLFGLPLVLGNLPEGTEIAVLEMGISTPGEMDDLASIAIPDVAVVTNVAPVHTEYFSDFSDLVREKARIWAWLREGGTACVPADDPLVVAAQERLRIPQRRILFGRARDAEVRCTGAVCEGLAAVRCAVEAGGEAVQLRLPIPGLHHAANVTAALAVAYALGVPLASAARGVEGARAVPGRGVVRHLPGGVDLLDESYNSNPRAMEAVLAVVAAASGYRRRCLVSGDMLELGPGAPALHREIGVLAAGSGVDLLVGVGPLSAETVDAARGAGIARAEHFGTSAEAAEFAAREARGGDLWIVKGSRGIGTDAVVHRLLRSAGPAAEERPEGSGGSAGLLALGAGGRT